MLLYRLLKVGVTNLHSISSLYQLPITKRSIAYTLSTFFRDKFYLFLIGLLDLVELLVHLKKFFLCEADVHHTHHACETKNGEAA